MPATTANAPANAPTSRVLTTKITALARRMSSWKKDSHDVAMDVMRHSFSLNGAGLDLLMRLYDALGTNGNREQFKRWASEYFPVIWSKDTFKLNRTEFKTGDIAWNFEGAKENPWYDMDTDSEAAAQIFDLEKLLKMLKNVATKAEKNGMENAATEITAFADILKSKSTTN